MNKRSRKDKPKNTNNLRTVGFILLIFLFGMIIYSTLNINTSGKEIPISEFIRNANEGQYSLIEISGDDIKAQPNTNANDTIISRKEPNTSIYDQGLNKDTPAVVEVKKESNAGGLWLTFGINILPLLLFGALIFFFIRSAQGQGNQALSFGKSRARLYGSENDKVTFADVAGNGEAKEDLEEVVEFLKFPKKFQKVGAKIPKGVLLVGPPGTGKTMLARAVAGEADVPFFTISGSEFVEMFVGVGASRVRDLFSKAKKNAPCIIFIDEIDAVGRKRGSGMGGGHDEREQTLNQILVEMDGFEQGQNIIVLAATNRADVLDAALLRPGRFDRRVNIGLPDRLDREAILKVHLSKKPTEEDVDIKALSGKTAGSSGADLANIANEAAIRAARKGRDKINNQDITSALEKVAIGPERKNKIMSDKDKELTAYHEAGHAIVGHVLPDSDMVHKVTIIPRGGTGGVTWFIPPEDKIYHSKVDFKDVLARMLGGRIAEKVIYGEDHVTTGAGNDLQKATDLAREMVIEQGMSDNLPNQVFHSDEGLMFDRMVHDRPYSEDTAQKIDKEVENLITEAAVRAEAVIVENKKFLEKLKEKLIEEETVEAEEVMKIFEGTTLPESAKLY